MSSTSSPSLTRRPISLCNDLTRLNLIDVSWTEPEPPVDIRIPQSSSQDDDELERFRSEWRQEVQAKKGVNVGPVVWKEYNEEIIHNDSQPRPRPRPRAQQPTSPPAPLQWSPTSPVKTHDTLLPKDEPPDTERSHVESEPRLGLRTRKMDKARDPVQMYAKAVENEQSGRLSEALMLYRQAFKLDDSVDQLYARSRLVPEEPPTPNSSDVVSPAAPIDEPYSFQRHIQTAPDYERSTAVPTFGIAPSTRPSPLTSLFQSLPHSISDTTFSPADENLPIPMATLPSEILDQIFLQLDVSSVERFASTCWRSRYLTSVSNIWKRLVMGIYRPPAILPPLDSGEGEKVKVMELVKRHDGEWRTVLVEEERIRMDGCYIAVSHYIRPGAGEQWVTITHMITYHRFLRFYPDGSVISFLTTEHPSEIVPLLRPSLRGKGLHFGRWRLIRSDHPPDSTNSTTTGNPQPAPMTNATTTAKRRAIVLVTDLLEPGAEPKYEFEMELALRETQPGRWNKMDILAYRTINLANGEVLGLALKHQKPFYFSKVRSYNPPL